MLQRCPASRRIHHTTAGTSPDTENANACVLRSVHVQGQEPCDAAPADLHGDATPIDLLKNAVPMDILPIDLDTDAAPIDLYRDATSIDLHRDATSTDTATTDIQ